MFFVNNGVEREVLRKVVGNERLAFAVRKVRPCIPKIIAKQVDEWRDNADPGLHEFHVDEMGTRTMGHRISVAGDVGGIEIGPEKLARAPGCQDSGLGPDDDGLAVPVNCVGAATFAIARDAIPSPKMKFAKFVVLPSAIRLPCA